MADEAKESLRKTKKDMKVFNTCCNEYHQRAINIPAVLLVLNGMATIMTLGVGNNIALLLTTKPEGTSCYEPFPESDSSASNIVPFLQNTIVTILFPITGWLADTKLGRSKAIKLSLWSNWLGDLLQLISLCIQFGTCGLPANIAKYGISVIALIFIMFGTASSLTNLLAFGLDQLIDKSNASIRAFIHWLIWGLFLGFSISYLAFVHNTIYDPIVLFTTVSIIFFVNSMTLCVFACFDYKFEHTGVLKKNPYKLVYQVLKYAWQHKSPENRSALTYWENKIPSRIDLSKEKYGGPFLEEEVEDVKTFWRVTGILFSTFGFYIVFFPTYIGAFQIMNSFEGAITTFNGYGSYILWNGFDKIIIVIIPIVELVIIPLFPKIEYFFLHSLRGIVITYCLLLISLISMIIITTVGYYYTPEPIPCFLISADNQVQLSYLFFAIPLFFSGLTSGIRFILIFEFIVSQAPVYMSGILVGISWFIQALYVNIGAWIQLPFAQFTLDGPGKLSCIFWVLMINLIILLIGLAVFIYAAKKYRKRKRGEDYNYQNVIEDTYARVLDHETAICKEHELTSLYELYVIDDLSNDSEM